MASLRVCLERHGQTLTPEEIADLRSRVMLAVLDGESPNVARADVIEQVTNEVIAVREDVIRQAKEAGWVPPKPKPVMEEAKPKLEVVTIKLRGLPDVETKVQVNPSEEQARVLLKKSKEGILRGMISDRGDLYFWDAYDATHSDFMGSSRRRSPSGGCEYRRCRGR